MQNEILWKSDLGNGKFKNPFLFADYSDPDVIRVGDTYYLTASSFNYTPGLPILTSHDLVNWKLVNYAIDNISEAGKRHEEILKSFDIPRHSEGVWAPAIRYHDGMFYIYYGMPDEGIYVVRTKDPLGKWEEPVCVLEGKGLIDSCPFWDEDGKAYIIHGYAKSRIGFKSILGIFEMSLDGMKAITEDHFVFDGNDPKHPALTIEGPKVYKRNGFYYILAPAGGVKQGWQVALRSKNIYGPYEIHTVMEQGNTVINGPHQGGLVDTVNGDEWFIHFQDKGLYGRICHLQPVTWMEDWPVMGVNIDNERLCGEPVIECAMPNTGVHDDITYLQSSDDFEGGIYGLQWQWLANHYENFVRKNDNKGLILNALKLYTDEEPVLWKCPNVLTQKLVCPEFEMEIEIDIDGLSNGDKAGVIMMGGQYAYAAVSLRNDKYELCYYESCGSDSDKKDVLVEKDELDIKDKKKLMFKMIFKKNSKDKPVLNIFYSFDGHEFEKTACEFEPSDHTWVGAKTGIFCISENDNSTGFAKFNNVKTKSL
ncbi:MAG: glycoside hydrolase 43 family protein [Butyrivibrio sp.]|nr:glycoside hydrolase 43 family protein [Butyrivibrio sp.]